MSRRSDQLRALARLARMRADLELRRYAAYRAQADEMRRHVDTIRDELHAAMTTPAGDALDQWRLTTALVGYRAGRLHRAEDGLARMQPAMDAARKNATVAFGRAEALVQLQRMTVAKDREARDRRS